jgi:hypothetical protein
MTHTVKVEVKNPRRFARRVSAQRQAAEAGFQQATSPVLPSLARVLAASSCDLGDGRDVVDTLTSAGIPHETIINLMDSAIEQARVVRMQDMGFTGTNTKSDGSVEGHAATMAVTQPERPVGDNDTEASADRCVGHTAGIKPGPLDIQVDVATALSNGDSR